MRNPLPGIVPSPRQVLVLLLPVVLIIAWAFEITPEGFKKTAHVAIEDSITRTTGQRLNYLVTALLAVAVVVLIIDNYLLGDGEIARTDAGVVAAPAAATEPLGPAAASVTAETEPAPLPNSIAVIPFTNMSPNTDDAYFAAGIHEEILNQLAKLGSLNVIARTSVMQYTGTQKPIPEIGRELNVEAVMEGSVRYANGQVLVTTQLIDAATNVHLWSESYQREFSDIFGIQSDIAMNVANALRAEYSPEEQASIEALPTDSIAAYDHYLLAQSLMQQGFTGATLAEETPVERAVGEYEAALALDPDFALARLGLAQSLGLLAVVRPGDAELAARVDSAMDAAVGLTDTLPAALGLVAQQQITAHEWAAADQTLQEWLARAPANDYAANLAYGTFLRNVGRARAAIPYLELARRIDPLLAGPSIDLTIAYDSIGETDRAIALHARMRDLVGYDFRAAAPQFWRLLARGSETEAFSAMAEAFEGGEEEVRDFFAANPNRADAAAVFGVFVVNRGQPDRGLVDLRAIYANPQMDNFVVMLNVALLAAYYDDPQLSVAALSKATLEGPPILMMFAWTPLMREVRGLPEFKALLNELALPEYWRAAGWPEHCRSVGADDLACS